MKPTFKVTEFQRFLVGEGSHRRSVSSIKYQIQPNLVTSDPGQPCELVVVERLGPGLFADPFELQRLVQRGVFIDAAVFGDTNLELPSALSNQFVVEVRVKINHVSDSNSREHEITVTLPLHARYPPLGERIFSTVEIGSPDMMIRCKHQVASYSWALYSLDSKSGEDTLLWMVPRGKESHAFFVSVVTAGSALLSAFVIVLASVCSLQMREKNC
ncbi:Phosphatidylinositol-glycan biosynthesis class 10 protein [Nymphaea thermarum]|nr:Phosphatidylinositol-glycan biosynthesis class 10 protein [Nymphaea thermarum]